MSSIPCTPKGNSKHHAADSHSCTSSLSSGSITGDWSIGSPVLSITSIDPCSPSLRFQDRPQGSRSGSAPFPISEVGEDEEAVRAADLRHKASNYLQYIESLSQAYESQLNALSAFFKINDDSLAGSVQDQFESYTDDPAVTIIEICPDGTRHLIGIDDVDMLVDYFCEQEEEEQGGEGLGGLMLQKNPGVSVISRVFLLDKITPDIMGVFGAKLGVEPQFWDAHLQLVIAKSMAESSNAAGSSGQLVRYGSEGGSKVSFLNIPLLRRYPSSESLDKKEGGKFLPPNQREESEGCSIYLDYYTNYVEPATAVDNPSASSSTTGASGSGINALDTLAPLLQQFQEQTEQVTQWLKDLDTAVVDSQRQREARLRRLKIVVPVCSISLAIGVVIVFVTSLGVPDGV
ncbi:hypothetical protein TWF788_003121 [Orbilia oligospora]|uniref:Uncharacterized protein n=1 Tax=Orbilia oligospora TaxID=2813651 RepID=A0A7C8K3K9_ORBOL|nr:hypothetical protein TWF788_003121 [Orbilia oligospora]